MALWDPATYLQFADERSRPFFELTQRVGATAPRRVVDLGCGPGQLTATLAARWPSAEVVGLDSSPEMVERARAHATEQLSFRVADLVDWAVVPDGEGDEAPDVLVANAALQWVPEHRALLPALVRRLAPDGWLAFQVPGNFAQPSHLLLHQLAAEPRFAGATQSVERPDAFGADVYLADLAAAGLAVEAWETTYLHVLKGRTRCSRGSPEPAPGRSWSRSTASSARPSSRSTRRCCGRPILLVRSGPCCRSAGCSSSRTGRRRDSSAPCPGLLPPRR